MVAVPNQPLGSIAAPNPSSPTPSGPGGNPIAPTPATPNDWWKMLIAIGIGASGIWMVEQLASENAARWLAFIVILGIITWYETHGNTKFSTMLQDTLGNIK